jgi:mono/diheme cytochrome c family protein
VEERRLSAALSVLEDAGFSPRGRTSLATMFAAMVLLALTAPAQAQKPSTASLTADLPAGSMQAKATTACLECHEARIILQQRLTKPAWTKEVDKMTKWGAVVDPADRDALIDYLSANFSPDQPAYNPQRTSASGKSSK